MRKAVSIICLPLLMLTAGRAQNWAAFPLDAKSIGCSTQLVSVIEAGSKEGRDVWESTAVATDSAGKTYRFNAGQFSPTQKGRHKAEKACSEWMDKAEDFIKRHLKR